MPTPTPIYDYVISHTPAVTNSETEVIEKQETTTITFTIPVEASEAAKSSSDDSASTPPCPRELLSFMRLLGFTKAPESDMSEYGTQYCYSWEISKKVWGTPDPTAMHMSKLKAARDYIPSRQSFQRALKLLSEISNIANGRTPANDGIDDDIKYEDVIEVGNRVYAEGDYIESLKACSTAVIAMSHQEDPRNGLQIKQLEATFQNKEKEKVKAQLSNVVHYLVMKGWLSSKAEGAIVSNLEKAPKLIELLELLNVYTAHREYIEANAGWTSWNSGASSTARIQASLEKIIWQTIKDNKTTDSAEEPEIYTALMGMAKEYLSQLADMREALGQPYNGWLISPKKGAPKDHERSEPAETEWALTTAMLTCLAYAGHNKLVRRRAKYSDKSPKELMLPALNNVIIAMLSLELAGELSGTSTTKGEIADIVRRCLANTTSEKAPNLRGMLDYSYQADQSGDNQSQASADGEISTLILVCKAVLDSIQNKINKTREKLPTASDFENLKTSLEPLIELNKTSSDYNGAVLNFLRTAFSHTSNWVRSIDEVPSDGESTEDRKEDPVTKESLEQLNSSLDESIKSRDEENKNATSSSVKADKYQITAEDEVSGQVINLILKHNILSPEAVKTITELNKAITESTTDLDSDDRLKAKIISKLTPMLVKLYQMVIVSTSTSSNVGYTELNAILDAFQRYILAEDDTNSIEFGLSNIMTQLLAMLPRLNDIGDITKQKPLFGKPVPKIYVDQPGQADGSDTAVEEQVLPVPLLTDKEGSIFDIINACLSHLGAIPSELKHQAWVDVLSQLLHRSVTDGEKGAEYKTLLSQAIKHCQTLGFGENIGKLFRIRAVPPAAEVLSDDRDPTASATYYAFILRTMKELAVDGSPTHEDEADQQQGKRRTPPAGDPTSPLAGGMFGRVAIRRGRGRGHWRPSVDRSYEKQRGRGKPLPPVSGLGPQAPTATPPAGDPTSPLAGGGMFGGGAIGRGLGRHKVTDNTHENLNDSPNPVSGPEN